MAKIKNKEEFNEEVSIIEFDNELEDNITEVKIDVTKLLDKQLEKLAMKVDEVTRDEILIEMLQFLNLKTEFALTELNQYADRKRLRVLFSAIAYAKSLDGKFLTDVVVESR